MTTDEMIKAAADDILFAAGPASNGDPYIAIGACLIAAKSLAWAVDMTPDELRVGFDLAQATKPGGSHAV